MNTLVLLVLACNILYSVAGSSKVEKTRSIRSILFQEKSRSDVHPKRSYVFFDNRSDRTAKLHWRNLSAKKSTRRWRFFKELAPGATIRIDTYNTNKWMAIDKTNDERLMISDKKWLTQEANTKDNRAIYIISRQGQANTSIEMFVETFIAVDKSVQDRFNSSSEVRNYVKVLMQMTSEVYQHESLAQHGIKIHLIPSKIDLLENEVKLVREKKSENLYTACEVMNKRGNRGPKRYDHKLFLTRNGFGAAGYARNSGMCSQYSSCSIIYDQGFSSVFLIAHEVSHSFGVHHGDFKQFSRYIMAPMVDSTFNNYKWSRHSQQSLLQYIRRYEYCLTNKPEVPEENDLDFENPGEKFSLEKQCDLEYGVDYSSWKGWREDPCAKLKCAMPGKWSFLYKTTGSPALDGTKCGENKWCQSGVCQNKPETEVEPTIQQQSQKDNSETDQDKSFNIKAIKRL